jgi:hypothetical protein
MRSPFFSPLCSSMGMKDSSIPLRQILDVTGIALLRADLGQGEGEGHPTICRIPICTAVSSSLRFGSNPAKC